MIKQYLILFVKRIQTTDDAITGKLELSITYNGLKRTPSHKPLLRNGVAVFYDQMLKFQIRKDNPTVLIQLFRLRPSSTSLLLSTSCSVSDFKPDNQLRVKFNQSQTYIDILSDLNNGTDQTRSLRRQPSVPRQRSLSRDDNRSQRSKVQRDLDQQINKQRQSSLGRGSFRGYKPEPPSKLVHGSGNDDTKSVYTPKAVSKAHTNDKEAAKPQTREIDSKTKNQRGVVQKVSSAEIQPTPAKSGPSRQTFQKEQGQKTIKPFQRSSQKTQTIIKVQQSSFVTPLLRQPVSQSAPKAFSPVSQSKVASKVANSNVNKGEEPKAQAQQWSLESLLKASVVTFLIGVYLGYSM